MAKLGECADAERKFGVKNSGLCLLMAYVIQEFNQWSSKSCRAEQPGSRQAEGNGE